MDVLFDFTPVFDNMGDILQAFWAVIRLTVTTGILSLILGTILAGMRVAPVRIFRGAGTLYVNVFRNTPLTLILAFCALGLSDTLHISLSTQSTVNFYWLAVFGLAAYTAAFICEALRSGINTVPLGQAEAARAVGLTFFQSLRLVILPQAFRSVIAPLGSIFIAMTKNTTVVIVASYVESAYIMRQLFEEEGATIPMFLAFAIGFMIITLPMGFFFGWLAKRLAVSR
ncbi:amino acid ABC transporter permease [Actinomadura rudentiformis]|uniref:Amino acid ABC transporter permease n=1 Tax=Actinomadura rudentiformis TaxID=359158 RepID=A0A6H9YU13_9ACTN|nr:amino acid ABC transporter permease [Actinomadura rudentiformis]KAB2345634.1 amino acid ABC transporter permease [Actinomadura rudentiformis]